MDNVRYFLVPDKDLSSYSDNFRQLVATLKSLPNIQVTEIDEHDFSISYADNQFRATLAFTPIQNNPTSDIAAKHQVMLTCDRTDAFTVTLLRGVAPQHGYRVFNPILGCFFAKRLATHRCEFCSFRPRCDGDFRRNGIQAAIYAADNTNYFY